MIHYICDRCKRHIDPAAETRYIVQIDIQSAPEHPSTDFGHLAMESADDVDHLAELHQMLEGIHDPVAEDEVESNHRGQYDLCPECHRQFMQNPLGRDAVLALGFSNN